MARRSKKRDAADAPKKAQPIPDKLARPFEQAMKSLVAAKKAEAEAKAEEAKRPAPAKAATPAPRPATAPTAKRPVDAMAHYGYDDRAAFHQAFADVRPMPKVKAPRRSGQAGPISEDERRARAEIAARVEDRDREARARLDALVAGSVRFLVERDDDAVYGRRSNAPDRTIDGLLARTAVPSVKIDLHGLDARAAATEVSKRIREAASRGVNDVLVVHGKGLHSEGGTGVLGDVVVEALTTSAAAPHVVAFATAPLRFGGSGAILVRIERR